MTDSYEDIALTISAMLCAGILITWTDHAYFFVYRQSIDSIYEQSMTPRTVNIFRTVVRIVHTLIERLQCHPGKSDGHGVPSFVTGCK